MNDFTERKRLIYGLVALTVLATLVFDLMVPLGIAAGVPYVVPVLFSLPLEQRRFTLIVAVLCTVLTVIGYFDSVSGSENWIVLTNRALTILAIWITALLGLVAIRAHAALRASEKQFRLILEAVPAMISYIDANQVYRYTNRARRDGLPELGHDLIGKTLKEVWSEEQYEEIRPNLEVAMQGETVYFIYEYTFGETGRRAVDVSFVPHKDTDGSVLGVYVLSNDITHFMESQEALKESRERLRNLARRLRNAREEERRMLSREIHDNLGQMLTALKMELSRLRAVLTDEQRELRQKLRETIFMTDEIINSTQETAMRLRPVMLSDLGLVDTIRYDLEQLTERNGITHTLEIGKEPLSDADDEFNTGVYRILQEALTNIIRHAQASHVDVAVGRDKEGFYLTVKDDGVGMNDAALTHPDSLGITGMFEYAMSLGGTLDFRHDDGGGTVVSLTVPYNSQGAA